jgi:hypothetical protein
MYDAEEKHLICIWLILMLSNSILERSKEKGIYFDARLCIKMRLLRRHRLKEDENPTYSPGNHGKVESDKRKSKDSTENFLRMIWELVVWPLILENDRAYFAVEEYKVKMDELCQVYEIQPVKLSGFLIALGAKGLLTKSGDAYWIHSKHMPYMQKKINLGYGRAVKEVYNIE